MYPIAYICTRDSDINIKRTCTVDIPMGDLDYLKWIGLYASKKKPLFSEFQSYTKFSGEKDPLEDYTTFCLAICIESDPKPFEDFLGETLGGSRGEQVALVWPQCKIYGNRLDLLIGLKKDSDEVSSCLIIEAKVGAPLDEGQLQGYIGKGRCKYLALTKNKVELEVENWTKSTWQDLANFINLGNYSSKLWNEFVNSMASNGIVSDLSGVPNMEIHKFEQTMDTSKKIIDELLDYYYSEPIKQKLRKVGLGYYENQGDHKNHVWHNQVERCNRFTIICDDRDFPNSWYLFGVFIWKGKWYAGGVVERKPEKNPQMLKEKLSNAGLENEGWELFSPEDSKDTTFGHYLVAMKAKEINDFNDKTVYDVVEYIKEIIDEAGKSPHVKKKRNIVYY